ncbi:hypothetical protein [Pseudonocardia humida]|uniref:Uncharacterized protein n=1 Tax=Pseudonocardia humida TaxID=2800819 RepID=A0ABT0ZZ20_9PSEU|nr:hypothetical protein [Pseudonocardia humida]MCO1655995.1 hypothetical protein [Pseudonocardia humida]
MSGTHRPSRPPWRDRSDTAWFLRWLLASWRGRAARRSGPETRPDGSSL